MGLSAPKNRSRIGNDPQNKTWADNTSRFGHRILTSQGWKPGSSLGSKNAAHSEHYTAASHSHIRVLLKEDTLGLGAKKGSERAENFGLAALESVLGRLNGKEEDVKKEEARREDIERRGYVARKYGFMNFVSGGFLVGDKMERFLSKGVEVKVEPKDDDVKDVVESKESKKSKKRKRSSDDLGTIKEEDATEQPKLKRKKKSMNLRETAAADAETAELVAIKSSSKSKKEKKDKKDKKDKKKSKKSSTSESETPDLAATPSEPALSDKAKRKAEKRARKEEKKLKKALKRAAKEAARSHSTADASSSSEDEDTVTPASTSAPTTGTSTPSGLTFGAGGRHAVRQRYIRQKKMASMDPQALKEIFMIKSPA